MVQTFFLEVGTTELPASYIRPALKQLQDQVQQTLQQQRIDFAQASTAGTPRRLVLIVEDVATQGHALTEELEGPPVRVAFSEDGTPKVPALKFAEKVGLAVEQLGRKQTAKGEKLCATVTHEGQATHQVLAEALPSILGRLHFPKSMRWGTQSQSFGRQIRWFCALLGEQVVPFSYAGVHSVNQSYGHRFVAPEPFAVESAQQYREALKQRCVLLDAEQRMRQIQEQSEKLAQEVNGQLVKDTELVEINAFLVESPHPLRGTFESKYLALPKEVLQTTMRTHLKCFSVVDDAGAMLPFFVPVAALPSKDPQVVVHGFERVLRARLADAHFFYDEDGKSTLEKRVPALDAVTFQKSLGSYGDKRRRLELLVVKLAPLLGLDAFCEEAQRAAMLCKSDLLTKMVYEFPELQGTMGRYYAEREQETKAISEALEQHYWPVGAEDQRIPQGSVAQLVAIADRLDTLVGGFAVGIKPTGSADPYGLRRQALTLLRILCEAELPGSLG
ncbi:MAG: glycine--tRNA ligase subunit beta, partial [Myxococcota bacterium]